MLDRRSSIYAHQAQNLGLIILSLVFILLDSFILLATVIYHRIWGSEDLRYRENVRRDLKFHPQKILVTGVGMTKGLELARAFFKAGHDVVGADFEPGGTLVCGRVSRALAAFYTLPVPDKTADSREYVEALKRIIKIENIELWVSCSGVVSAVDDGRAKEIIETDTSCMAIQFDAAKTEMLHEKDSFIKHVSDIGLTIPETYTVTNTKAALEILGNHQPGKQYIMKPIGVDDANRADMTLLPRPTRAETENHLSNLEINEKHPWILQQFIKGDEYCTQALVVRGQVRAFVACPSAELLMHYEALPVTSRLSDAMLEFTKSVAQHAGPDFTGHLSFDFLVDSTQNDDSEGKIDLYPIECNPRCHTAVVLFRDESEALSNAYTSILEHKQNENKSSYEPAVLIPKAPAKYYWIGHDLVTRLILPLIWVLTLKMNVKTFAGHIAYLLKHLLLWRDGTFEVFDPYPWWWLYHVYWPIQFFNSIIYGEKWSRVNVSTTKMFKC